VLGQAHAPRRRAFGIAIAASCFLVLPAVGGAVSSRSGADGDRLRAENASLASKERSAVLGLYALDTELVRAQARLAELERQAAALRREQVVLQAEMKVALSGARTSQNHLASRVRLLFDHGDTSTLEIIFGARSLEDALAELDSLEHVTSINNEVLAQLEAAKTRISRTSRALDARTARLAAAVRAQEATTQALAAARAEREAYIAGLRQQRQLNTRQIATLQAQAQAASARTQQLAARTTTSVSTSTSTSTSAAPVATGTVNVVSGGRTLAVSAVAYSLPGHTASGLPVGWGIVAVDPSVIPLGTRMTVPGYGRAVAADTGSAVKGAIIDLWFPTVEMARAWGRRSVTITLD
jgi:3D (Asp-Asp-Asp) domain-containing protein